MRLLTPQRALPIAPLSGATSFESAQRTPKTNMKWFTK
jgi:hypothetical protein